MNSLLKRGLEKLECHFTWDLGQYQNELQGMKREMDLDVPQKISSPVHYYNLLGFIQKSLGSDREALESLQKAESVIQEQGTEETAVRLLVNKANMAWVHFHLGELEKSRGYLEELEELQRIHPAPPGCPLHPEVSGEKGWTLVKFNKSKKRLAIDYFKMALEAEPERKEWHKGLALSMSKACLWYKCTPEQKAEILEKVKTAAEINPNDLLLQALYLVKLSDVTKVNVEREMRDLLERCLEIVNVPGLNIILKYLGDISFDESIREGERFQERYPESIKVLKCLADTYKWKVYKMNEDTEERVILARKTIELLEKVCGYNPDSHRAKVALAAMHYYAHNTERADEIYQQLLLEEELSPDKWQYIYYCYASYLNQCKRFSESVQFHIKGVKTPGDSVDKEKSLNILKKIVWRGKDPLCSEIRQLLKTTQK
uniref:interferon-induced protein with tetratricopeptide repeats 15 n=1 Tax=Danio rerio TaxID=7955 RepID=UPI003D9DD01E